MDRIEKKLRDTENMIVYLASNPKLAASDRDRLLPVLTAHLETANQWKLFKSSTRG